VFYDNHNNAYIEGIRNGRVFYAFAHSVVCMNAAITPRRVNCLFNPNNAILVGDIKDVTQTEESPTFIVLPMSSFGTRT